MKITWNQEHPDQALQIMSLDELNASYPQLLEKTYLLGLDRPLHFTKVMLYQGELSGTFVIPEKEQPIRDQMSFGFILDRNTLYFIEDKGDLKSYLQKFMTKYDREEPSPYKFLLLFMNYIIQEDIYFLEDYNARLEDIEEQINDGHSSGMDRFIMMARRDMNTLDNYYLQLSAVGETMQETVIPQNMNDENAMVSLLLSRCSQLLSLVGSIKDYTSQIWNLRQTQLSDKQNKISTLLTVITTLFLPVTFVTGWYGMNLRGMPLVESRYGYPIVICFVLVVVFLEIRFIRARHWLSDDKKSSVSIRQAKKEFTRKERKDFKHKDTGATDH